MCKFSVIIPIYNEGPKFRKKIDILYKEKYSDFELILVDDGSTDCSGVVCDEISIEFKNCKVIHKENGGGVSARQAGINIAEGQYIVFVDADDYILPGYFSSLCKAVEHKADIYLLNSVYCEEDSEEIHLKDINFQQGYVDKKILYKKILFGNDVNVWSKIYVREIIANNKIFFTQKIMYADDVYINLKYSRFVQTVYCQNSANYLHIFGSPTSVTKHHISIKRINEMNIVYKEASAFINDMKVSEEVRKGFYSSYIYILANVINDIYLCGDGIKKLQSAIKKMDINDKLCLSNYDKIAGKMYAYLIYKGYIRSLAFVLKIRNGKH